MSGIVKGISKAVKGVFKGIKKVFSEVFSSDLGKILLIAGAIYLGGAALGAWESGTAVDGILVSAEGALEGTAVADASVAAMDTEMAAVIGESAGGAEAALAADAGVTGMDAAMTSTLESSVQPVSTAGTSGVTSATTDSQMASNFKSTTDFDALGNAAPEVAKEAGKGIFSTALQGIKDNKLATVMGMQGLSAMMTEPPMTQAEIDEEKQKRIRRNFQGIENVSMGMRPGSGTLTRPDGSSVYGQGIVNRNRGNA